MNDAKTINHTRNILIQDIRSNIYPSDSVNYVKETFCSFYFFYFFQAEDGIRDFHVTGVQTCALPILTLRGTLPSRAERLVAEWMAWAAPGVSDVENLV